MGERIEIKDHRGPNKMKLAKGLFGFIGLPNDRVPVSDSRIHINLSLYFLLITKKELIIVPAGVVELSS